MFRIFTPKLESISTHWHKFLAFLNYDAILGWPGIFYKIWPQNDELHILLVEIYEFLKNIDQQYF